MMMAPEVFQRHRERGGESPPPSSSSLTFPLDGRRVSPPVLGFHGGRGVGAPPRLNLSLFPSNSALPDSALSPFLKFPEIRNSDWAEIWTRFLSAYWLSFGERRAPTALRSGHEGPGRAPHPRGPLGHRLALILLPKIHMYSKTIYGSFYPVWTPFDMDFLRNKIMQKTGTGTGHWINMLVPKIV